MQAEPALTTRNRAILGIRTGTAAAVFAAVGLSWLFAILAEDYFSGKPPATPPVPQVPQLAAPVQKAPPVVTTTVHKTGYPPSSTGPGPRPPGTAPGAAPPPPAPVCHSTPSKPC